MNRISVSSPANIALIKYWGLRDELNTLPNNASLSMTLSRCVSLCTLAPLDKGPDEILWKTTRGALVPADPTLRTGIEHHLLALREHFDDWQPLRIATTNSFPTGAGIASSASGFSALATAFAAHCGHSPHHPDLSDLARLSGSGSAARSVFGGFVQWPRNAQLLSGPALQLAPARHWPLHDLIAVVDARHKTVSSRQGHLLATGSAFYPTRLKLLPERLEHVRQAILNHDFPRLAEAVEREAIELHMIAMTSRPPIFYWQPATLAVLERVRQLRGEGLDVCATLDAGPNVHVLCTAQHSPKVFAELRKLRDIQRWILDRAGDGPRRLEQHLF